LNRTNLKNYAPKARREFIEAMIERAAFYGLTADKTEPIVEKGDVAVIGGRSFPIAVARKRKSLENRIKRHGFQQTMEAMAYTWFNRLVAIRYMELHGYLDHGYRVLSHPDGKPTPEILDHAEHVEFPGLKKDRAIDLKLAGNKEGELYRLLLTAQCNALHSVMPFLFERIDDETELLLPDNLLNSDSLIRKLVIEIDEADWQEVEIIGWLYQFYISERKDEVIGKVVASEDIPAATQLFTPNWIVKYLVQNTLGRQWLATYPESPLRQQMEYYIEPAEQTSEVQEQLKAITPTSLNPEELTLLDPACGSGHILVEAYDLLKAIYQERGYRARDIPALILQKNLFGMEIDDRAAQLASFALMMKARADDRRIFDSEAKPNILAFEDTQGMNASEIHFALTSSLKGEKNDELESPAPNGHLFEPDDNLFARTKATKAAASRTQTTVNFSKADVASLLELFENAKTLGSLIQVPLKLAAKLPEMAKRLDNVLTFGDLTHASAHVLKPLLQQAQLLARKYDIVVANPPYMGGKYFEPALKRFMKTIYTGIHQDLFAAFIIRGLKFANTDSACGFVTPFVWLSISSYYELRKRILAESSISSLVKPSYTSFFESAIVSLVAFVLEKKSCSISGSFFDLGYLGSAEIQPKKLKEGIQNPNSEYRFISNSSAFKKIPSFPIAYWASTTVLDSFQIYPTLSEFAKPNQALVTGNTDRYVRTWWEVDLRRIGFNCADRDDATSSEAKWFPYHKGGNYRKWYGNLESVVNWENDGHELRTTKHPTADRIWAHNFVLDQIFREALVWAKISSGKIGFRYSPTGFLFDDASGVCTATSTEPLKAILGFLTSPVAELFLKVVSPTVNVQPGDLASLPYVSAINGVPEIVDALIQFEKTDWDWFEFSWAFQASPICNRKFEGETTVESGYNAWLTEASTLVQHTKKKEEACNRLFIDSFKLGQELIPDVSMESLTLLVNPVYRYGLKVADKERSERFRRDTVEELISYSIGCMMGRYSLDKQGLIFAFSGNDGFDSSQYTTFRADDDGIIPVLETELGIRDDATNRFVEFIGVAWPKEYLAENLKFVADSLGPSNGEQPRETIRRYLASGFYKHHLSMYKKRPIYWLFSSGKLRAFQCLVYLHRYNEGTLARMRTEYVIPLQGQIASRIDQLEGDKAKATSTSHRNKIQKEQDKLKKQQVELASFEEKLKHYADMRISLDLDDGVKVNYAKFGDLLAESKAITGGKDDE
jgi:type II restriction/modification system DNA methylase subunit YeeA